MIGGGLQSGFQMNSNYGVAPYMRYSPDVENNMVNELFSVLLLLLLLEHSKHFIQRVSLTHLYKHLCKDSCTVMLDSQPLYFDDLA